MTFSIFFPPAIDQARVPILYYLSGLSCTDRNAMEKVRQPRHRIAVLLLRATWTLVPLRVGSAVWFFKVTLGTERWRPYSQCVCMRSQSGLQRKAAQLRIAVVSPDTSPRGLGIPGEDDDYDFGTSAGFYLNATQVGSTFC